MPVLNRQTKLPVGLSILILNVLVLFCLHLVVEYIYSRGLIPEQSLDIPTSSVPRFFAQGDDSWRPMLLASEYLRSSGSDSVYETLFFRRKLKFQYPLTSILPIVAIQRIGLHDHAKTIRMLKLLGALALLLYIACTVALALVRQTVSTRHKLFSAVTIAATALLFHPVMRGYNLGQLQTVINALFALAFLCFVTGNELAAGLLVGLMALMKPQYAVIIIWGFIRGKRQLAYAATLCVTVGFVASLLSFGLSNNFDYFRVLKLIAKHGESYFANQSVNGLLNRLLLNGDNTSWTNDGFPPYNPVVHFGTLITSALIIISSLAVPRNASGKGGVLDFALIALACTMASPVAWEHHYGITLPLFVWLFTNGDNMPMPRASWLLLSISLILLGADLSVTNLTAAYPPFNVLQSYVLIGGLSLMLMLHKFVRAGEISAVSPRVMIEMGTFAK
jgi:alpha-1,2-mannosyltransferase